MAMHVSLRAREVRAELLGHRVPARCRWCGATFRTGGGATHHPYCSYGCRWTAEKDGGSNLGAALMR
jgi:hypothetical protein